MSSVRGARCLMKICLLPALVMIVSLWPAPTGFSQEPAKDPVQPYTIELNVDLAVLDVTVLDSRGRIVSGLEEADFKVYENDLPRKITLFHHEDIPVTVGLVVDSSGSMRGKRSEVIAAALAFVRASHPLDEVFVVHFNEDVELGLPLNELFSNQIDRLNDALSSLSPDGKTALYDAMNLALEHLQKGHYPKKALLLISDGADNASKHSFKDTTALALESNAAIYTIGLYDAGSRDRNPGVLKQLSSVSGGQAYFPHSIQEIEGICRQIATDIRRQYTIGYVPSEAAREGEYRKVQLEVHSVSHGKLFVRTRQGYITPNLKSPDKNSAAPGNRTSP